jgi:hypothetical protein
VVSACEATHIGSEFRKTFRVLFSISAAQEEGSDSDQEQEMQRIPDEHDGWMVHSARYVGKPLHYVCAIT